MMASTVALVDALAWVADGEIVIHDEGHGSRVITRAEAIQLATIYATASADMDVDGAPLMHVSRWMADLEAAITATAPRPMVAA